MASHTKGKEANQGKPMPSVRKVLPIVVPIAEALGIALVRAAYEREHGALFLRIYIEKNGRNVDLRECERFHRLLIPEMDAVEYDYLEVCSLGADAPLTRPEDFQRCIGEKVDARLFTKVEGKKVYEGILTGYTQEGITVREGEKETFLAHKALAMVKPVIEDVEEIGETTQPEADEGEQSAENDREEEK